MQQSFPFWMLERGLSYASGDIDLLLPSKGISKDGYNEEMISAGGVHFSPLLENFGKPIYNAYYMRNFQQK